nr:CAAX prenyl protease-related protein [Desulfobulbaceae bacterium]
MIPFIVPFALYLLGTQLLSYFPDQYPLLYPVCVVLVGAATLFLLRGKDIVKIHGNIASGVIVGVVGVVAWILICRLDLEQLIFDLLPDFLQPEQRPSFNPFQSINSTVGQWGFIAMRMTGLAVLVPLVEEIFWRGFLLRWVISPDWQDQEIGVFTFKSFAWITVLFALAHPEWIAAAVYCILLNLLLYWRRDLWNCIVAHATSNALLGVYVLYTKTWELW